jgi:hypothetical protein
MTYRVVRPIENPDAYTILVSTCGVRATLTWNDECVLVSFGEDGNQPVMLGTREYLIEEQNSHSGEFQEWVYYESLYDVEVFHA